MGAYTRIKNVAFFCAAIFPLLFGGCTSFAKLGTDLREAKTKFTKASGRIEYSSCKQNCETIVAVLGDLDGRSVQNVQVYDGNGPFAIQIMHDSKALIAFHDRNQNLQFDKGEPFALQRIDSEVWCPDLSSIRLVITDRREEQPPKHLGVLFDKENSVLDDFRVQADSIVQLSDKRFDEENAELGMWQPVTFLHRGWAGIYFLQPYDPKKIPVLFVHGINGTPRHFQSMIASLDQTKFQPWVVYYPSSVRIRTIGNQLYSLLNQLRIEYRFNALHVVAHSMGGLVAKDYLNQCSLHQGCKYLRSFTSISSPFGGHSGAATGMKYAPVPMPVWKHLDPQSAFLAELFRPPLPNGIPHYLIFGFNNQGVLNKTSGDGVITLESQLRDEAQLQAKAVRGFNDDHMSILENSAVHGYINHHLHRDLSQ